MRSKSQQSWSGVRGSSIIAGCVLCVWAAAPAAASQLTTLGRTTGPPVSDGSRYIAYLSGDGKRVVTVDSRTGRRTHFRVSKRCYSPRAISAGRVVIWCWTGNDSLKSTPRFFTRQGDRVHTTGIDAYAKRIRDCSRGGCFADPVEIGDVWVKTRWEDGYQRMWDFTNLRTGEVRPLSTSPDEFEDVDRPSLTVPLCPSLHRTATTSTFPEGHFDPFVFRSPWAVETHLPTVAGRSSFKLLRCGRSKPMSRSHGYAGVVELTRRHFLWVAIRSTRIGLELHALRLGTRHRRTWRMPPLGNQNEDFSYALTRRWIYAFNPGRSGGRGTLMRARLP